MTARKTKATTPSGEELGLKLLQSVREMRREHSLARPKWKLTKLFKRGRAQACPSLNSPPLLASRSARSKNGNKGVGLHLARLKRSFVSPASTQRSCEKR